MPIGQTATELAKRCGETYSLLFREEIRQQRVSHLRGVQAQDLGGSRPRRQQKCSGLLCCARIGPERARFALDEGELPVHLVRKNYIRPAAWLESELRLPSGNLKIQREGQCRRNRVDSEALLVQQRNEGTIRRQSLG